MKPAARGRNDKADRWSPGAREVESNDAPAGGGRGCWACASERVFDARRAL
jgi:hypothetical protein